MFELPSPESVASPPKAPTYMGRCARSNVGQRQTTTIQMPRVFNFLPGPPKVIVDIIGHFPPRPVAQRPSSLPAAVELKRKF